MLASQSLFHAHIPQATGSFWANAVPFAAALSVIPLAAAAVSSMERLGLELRAGLAKQAAQHGFGDDFIQSGPPQMPYFSFKSEGKKGLRGRRRILLFCSEAVKRGVWHVEI